ncbi:MAG: DegT/DnrJ/EryC1/StrS family aminotransferase, partial [Thermodesulfobacteriota bacterium]|nr:DegT/DnrJ/EryC1/StrS family aminotransferase [Thermodesulfobacteriota bacterium]
EMQDLGFNGRITDIQCALGISQLRRLGQFKAVRQTIVKQYNLAFHNLAERDIVLLPPWPEETDPCYHLYPLRLGPNCAIQRDELFERLRGKGIYCQVHYIPIYRQPLYQGKYHFDIGRFPEAEKYFATCLSLPLFPGMDEEMVGHVTESIKSMLNPDTIL